MFLGMSGFNFSSAISKLQGMAPDLLFVNPGGANSYRIWGAVDSGNQEKRGWYLSS